jgi:TolB-like protein/DNA-binding SARP family transcriptional activator
VDAVSGRNNTVRPVESGDTLGRFSLRLLGGFELKVFPGGRKVPLPGKRERALLAYLALSAKGRQPRRKLAALLWGDATDETLLDNLRTCVWRLRKSLEDTNHRLLASEEEDIVLDVSRFEIDVLAFRELAHSATQEDLEKAAALCGGDFLNGLDLSSEEFESWRRMETARHLDQAVEALSRLMRLLMENGQNERAIDVGTQILALDPLHEATVRHVMKLYVDGGRRGAAIQLYRGLAEALRRDVNAQPAAETRIAFEHIAQAGEIGRPRTVSTDVAVRAAPLATARPTTPQREPRRPRALSFSIAAVVMTFMAAIALGSSLRVPDPVASGTQSAGTFGRAAPVTGESAPTAVAVLPFENLSGDPSQQFFSDGMTEEISAALAKVPGLEVVARTSAFHFRGNRDARQVGHALSARYVLEGSVRKEDDRVRIAAQLVRTETGRLVWADTYERQSADIFAIQEGIAKSIATELRLSVAQPSAERLVPSREIDSTGYEQYLRARPLVRARATGADAAIQILETLVNRYPRFAPAWALLAQTYAMMPAFVSPYTTVPGRPDLLQRRDRIEKYWPKAENAARRAIQLAPNLPEGYLAYGELMHFRGKLAAADDLFAKALAIDHYNPDALALKMNLMADVGRLKQATAIAQQLLALDPYVPTWKQDAAEIYWIAGQRDRAVQLLMQIPDRPSVPTSLAMIYSSEGRYADAAGVMEAALKLRGEMVQNQSPMWRTAAAYLRAAPAKARASGEFPRLGRVDWVFLHVGAPEQSLEIYESEVGTGLAGGQGDSFGYLWHPSFAGVRHSIRFKTLMKNAGMVDYWRQRGWPDFCRPLGGSDFTCT